MVAAAAGEVRAAPVPTSGSGKAMPSVGTQCRRAASFPLLLFVALASSPEGHEDPLAHSLHLQTFI